MLIYAIGDIHGELEKLRKMNTTIQMHKAERQRDAELVYLGDYVDRGPDSKGVIDFLMLQENTNTTAKFFKKITHLKGNHEDMMWLPIIGKARMDDMQLWYGNGGHETMKSYSKTGDPIDAEVPQSHIAFLGQLKMYYQVEHFVFAHAGVDPTKTLEEQTDHDLLWSRYNNNYNHEYPLGWWVTHGHTPTQNYRAQKAQISIDTGAVFGGPLTCVVYDTDAPFGHYEILQVT